MASVEAGKVCEGLVGNRELLCMGRNPLGPDPAQRFQRHTWVGFYSGGPTMQCCQEPSLGPAAMQWDSAQAWLQTQARELMRMITRWDTLWRVSESTAINILWIEYASMVFVPWGGCILEGVNGKFLVKLNNFKCKSNKPTAKGVRRLCGDMCYKSMQKKFYMYLGEPSYCFYISNMSLISMCESTSMFGSVYP